MFIAYFFERKDSIVRVVFVSLGIECAVMAVKHWCGIFFMSNALKCVCARYLLLLMVRPSEKLEHLLEK